MDIELSLSCFGKNIEKITPPTSHELLIEKNNQNLSLTYRNNKNLDLDEMIEKFLKIISNIDLPTFDQKLLRIAFFVHPSDGVAFFSTEISSNSISAIKSIEADLEVSFYPCSE